MLQKIYQIESITDDVWICRVDIAGFVRRCLRGIPSVGYERRRKVTIDDTLFAEEIFSEEEVERLNGFKTLKKQVEWMSGRYAVKKLVSVYGAGAGVNLPAIEVGYAEEGAPRLTGFPGLSISISHSHNLAVAGISLGKGVTIGLDIERIEERDPADIVRVAFSDREKKELVNGDPLDFYTRWTAKEAYLKYIGRGFNESLKKVEFLGGNIYHHNACVDGIRCTHHNIGREYAFTVVHGVAPGQPEA